MNCLAESLPIIIYILLIILLIILIIFLLKSIVLLGKVDRIIKEVNDRVNRLNPLFHMLDNATDALAFMGDRIVGFVVGSIGKLFKKKEEKEDE